MIAKEYLTDDEIKMIQEYIDRNKVMDISLFGSKLHGTSNDKSDIDLFINPHNGHMKFKNLDINPMQFKDPNAVMIYLGGLWM